MQARPRPLTYPKPSKGPDMKEFQKSLSHLMWVFLQPTLETNSMVCWGVKASMVWAERGGLLVGWKGWQCVMQQKVQKRV